MKKIQADNASRTIIRMPDVSALTGLARATIYKLMKQGAFPRTVPLSDSNKQGAPVGFVLSEILAWVDQRIAKRDQDGAQ